MQPEQVGRKIRELRLAADFSVEELAGRAATTGGTISRIERAEVRSPGFAVLQRIARALGYDTVDGMLAADASTVTATAPTGTGRPADWQGSNVAGTVGIAEPPPGARQLPVYRWGTCGDPRLGEAGPDPDHLEYPPVGRESLIGPRGFGVIVKGDSMTARGINDGDVCWVNPDRQPRLGGVVLARLFNGDGDSGMVVKVWAATPEGPQLVSARRIDPPGPLVHAEHFEIIGPVVRVTSDRPPG